MIDRETFQREMAALDDRFPGDRSGDVLARYYRWLNPRMDTDAFLQAAERLFATRKHFPSPADFVDATGNGGSALAQWDLCRQIMSDRRGAEDLLERMSEEGRRVVRAMGGPAELCRTKLDEVAWRRKEFMRLYGTASEESEREKLPPMSENGREQLREAASGTRLLE